MFRIFQAFFIFIVFNTCIFASVALPCSAQAAERLININNAPPTVLAENLPGIGPAKARAIVSYREQHGPFKTLAELIQVKGIGELTLKKIRPLLTVEEYSSKNMDTGTLTKPVKSQAKVEADVVRAVQAAVNVARRYKHDKSSQP